VLVSCVWRTITYRLLAIPPRHAGPTHSTNVLTVPAFDNTAVICINISKHRPRTRQKRTLLRLSAVYFARIFNYLAVRYLQTTERVSLFASRSFYNSFSQSFLATFIPSNVRHYQGRPSPTAMTQTVQTFPSYLSSLIPPFPVQFLSPPLPSLSRTF